jgi:hypothetical protein
MNDAYLRIAAVGIVYVLLLFINNKTFKNTDNKWSVLIPFIQFFFIWFVFWRFDKFLEISTILIGSFFGILCYLLGKITLKFFKI